MNNNYVSKAGSWERDSNTQFGGSCVFSWITALPSHHVDQADESNHQAGMLKRHRCFFRGYQKHVMVVAVVVAVCWCLDILDPFPFVVPKLAIYTCQKNHMFHRYASQVVGFEIAYWSLRFVI